MLEVVTGSRLHFGLLELASGQPMRYGGLGLMLDKPGWVLRFKKNNPASPLDISTAESIATDISSRIEQVRERMQSQLEPNSDVDFTARVDVMETLPLHSGLGSGTQLATAVAWGLSLVSRPLTELNIEELLRSSGRGKRSGIGLYGFIHGGLILDAGHTPDAHRTVRATSVHLNPAWRVVLITPDQKDAVTGGYEASLLERLGQSPNPNRARMIHLAQRCMELAHSSSGFAEFTSLLQEYVDAAGQLFAASQGGLYNGESVTLAVELAKKAGLRAVGQSSWGPTVFGFAEQLEAAENSAAMLMEQRPNERWQIRVCTPARQGASWRWVQE